MVETEMMKGSLVRWTMVVTALMGVTLTMVLVWSQAASAAPDGAPVVVAQVSPYQPPELTNVVLPSWVVPIEPIARLPLWTQAALASAVLVSAFFVLRVISQWAWGRFFGDAEGNSP